MSRFGFRLERNWLWLSNQSDRIPNRFQAPRQSVCGAFGIAPVEVIPSALLILNSSFGQNLSSDQRDPVCYGDSRFLHTTPLRNTKKEPGQEAAHNIGSHRDEFDIRRLQ
jgi:hypothetical protein